MYMMLLHTLAHIVNDTHHGTVVVFILVCCSLFEVNGDASYTLIQTQQREIAFGIE